MQTGREKLDNWGYINTKVTHKKTFVNICSKQKTAWNLALQLFMIFALTAERNAKIHSF